MFDFRKGGSMPPTPHDAKLLEILHRKAEQMERDFKERMDIITGDNVAFKECFNNEFIKFRDELLNHIKEYEEVLHSYVGTLSETLDGKYTSLADEYQKATDALNVDFSEKLLNALNEIEERFTNLSEGQYDDFATLRAEIDSAFEGHIAAVTDRINSILANGGGSVSGDNGKDGVGIKNIAQTIESTADGGVNVIAVTLTDDRVFTFNVRNGNRGTAGTNGENGVNGANGYTPVRGTDYWTAADIAEMKSYIDTQILNGAW